MFRSARWVLGSATGFALLMAPLAVTTSTAMGADASAANSLVTYYDAAWPFPDLTGINKENQSPLETASELIDFNKTDFAGLYVDGDSSQLYVVAATDKGLDLALKTFADEPVVTVRRGSLSLDAANQRGLDLSETIPSVGAKMYHWAIDPESSALKVGVNAVLTDEERAEIDQFAQESATPLEVYTDETAKRPVEADSRQEDSAPYAGGFRYVATNSSTSASGYHLVCSGGFGYSSGGVNYMLTAGHCFEKATTYDYMWNTLAGTCCTLKAYAGHPAKPTYDNGTGTVKTGSDNAYHGDLAIVNVDNSGHNSGDQIWWGGTNTTSKIPLTVRRVPTPGDPVCINGVTSGSDCGTNISETNTSWTYQGGDTVINVDDSGSYSVADCAQHGDSGGSVIYNHGGAETQATAIGIVSGFITGGLPDCINVFTGIEEAIQAWGGNIKFH